MAITQQEADAIEEKFLDAFDAAKGVALKAKEAWDALYALMKRENRFSDKLGVDTIDWQIGNWANDVTMELHNAGRYTDAIEVNENILSINWGRSNDLFHENALRDIADEYAYMGNLAKCLELYEEYLKKDPLWGWGWIGYYRQLNKHGDDRFEKVLDDLYKRVNAGEDFRDKEDLYRELGDEYNTLGNQERAYFFYGLEDAEREKEKANRRSFSYEDIMRLNQIAPKKKIYPNDPCPCGSGKKYKKCCGRK